MEDETTLSVAPTHAPNSLIDGVGSQKGPDVVPDESLALDELVEKLPSVIAEQKKLGVELGSRDDQVFQMLEQVEISASDMKRYGHSDPDKNYTRNLVATDCKSYTLLLLCWSPDKCSPIHDHPCDGCWMRVVDGQVRECRYELEEQEDPEAVSLICTNDETFTKGEVAFINDSIGYHKVGNNGTDLAVTLHLYSPPFQECRAWLDNGKKACTAKVCYYSAYGRRI